MATMLVAVCAMSAATASTALAAPEWLAQKGGVFNRLTGALTVKPTTKLVVSDSKLHGGVSLSCEGVMEGAIEAGGVGKISSYVVHSCKAVAGTCGGIKAEPEHLPWKTELYLAGGEFRVRLVSGGSGTPQWRFSCESVEDTCGFNTSAQTWNSGTGVEAVFGSTSNKTSCTAGGSEAGRLEGSIVFAHPEGVEAIEIGEVANAEWRQEGIGVTKAISTTLRGPVKVTDSRGGIFGEKFAVECEAAGEGTAGGVGGGTVTKVTMSKCVSVEGVCSSPTLQAVNLPWNTALTILAGVHRNLISEDGKGVPRYEILCFGAVEDACSGPFDAVMENVLGGVDAKAENKKLTCERNGSSTGSVEGTQLIQATAGGKLEVH